MSENSSDRTWVTPAESAETMSGNRSVIPPGWMPVPCSVEPPASQAATRAPGGRRVRVDPADRRDDVLARPEQRDDLVLVGHQRRVDDAVGVAVEDLLLAGGREHADRLAADDLADVLAVLVRAVHPGADELELGVREHVLDGGLADPAGGPLGDSDRSCTEPRSRF